MMASAKKLFGLGDTEESPPPPYPEDEKPDQEKTSKPKKTEKTTVKGIADKIKDEPMLDLAFAMDCTGSMGSYIKSAQQSIRDIVKQVEEREGADCRFALVEYRDHPPQDSSFITRVHSFTDDVSVMRSNLNKCQASGGGDQPEAVAAALHDCLQLGWRPNATKIAILISDAPPHGLPGSHHDGFPNGCPQGHDPIQICHSLAESGVTLYCIGCEPSITPFRDFFEGMCQITGGQYCNLGTSKFLSDVIVGGAVEEMANEQLVDVIDDDIQCEEEDEEEQIDRAYERLKKANVKSNVLTQGGESRAKTVSEVARNVQKCKTLKDASSTWAKLAPSSAPPPASRASSSYCVENVEISREQCAKIVRKSRGRKGW